jgi:cell division protein FtsQ
MRRHAAERRRDLGLALPSGRSLFWAFALVCLAAALYLAALETPLFALRSLDVRGAPPALEAQIRHALEPLGGSSLVTLDRGDLERRLGSLPGVASFAYDRDFPHTLRLTVVPEQPAAVLRQGADSWLVSASGRVLEPVATGTLHRLPRIWAGRADATPEPGETLAGDVLAAALLAGRIEASALAGRVRSVETAAGEAALTLGSGLSVLLGRPVNVPLKLEIAGRIADELGKPPAPGSYLDLTLPVRPVLGKSQPEDRGR